jgi:hypothetical protein
LHESEQRADWIFIIHHSYFIIPAPSSLLNARDAHTMIALQQSGIDISPQERREGDKAQERALTDKYD